MTQPQQYQQQPAPQQQSQNPWEQAAAQYGQPQPQQYAPPMPQAYAPPMPQAYAPPMPQQSNLADTYEPEPEDGESQLFSGGSTAMSLLNKTHGLGAERTGIITVGPVDIQDQDFDTKAPKYWAGTRVPGQKPITFDPIDRITGQRNKKVLSTHIEMSTDYRVTRDEWMAIGRKDEFQDGQDDGLRKFVASGQGITAMKKAMQQAQAAGIKLAKADDFVGLRLTVKRAGQKPNQIGNPSWIYEITLTRP